MKGRKWSIYALVFIVIVVLIKWYSINKLRIENDYSVRVYPNIGSFLRALTGWLPVSIGDILYALGVFSLLFFFVKFSIAIYKKTITWKKILEASKKLLITLSMVYIVFNVLWGFNYDRLGIAYQLALNMEPYSSGDIKKINELLLYKVNSSKQVLINKNEPYPSTKELFVKVKSAYGQLSKVYPFLNYQHISIKSSLWGWLGNYTGFTGYYNPFTGEAQVNTSVPKFLQPYIACHEVAHQLGYAKEMEANFVGYLAASSSTETVFHYSVYLDLFLYSNRNLRHLDSAAAKQYSDQLLPAVKEDLKVWSEFNKAHSSFIEPIVKWGYGKYLQSNRQPQGMMAYDEVTAFLIAYYKKFGKI